MSLNFLKTNPIPNPFSDISQAVHPKFSSILKLQVLLTNRRYIKQTALLSDYFVEKPCEAKTMQQTIWKKSLLCIKLQFVVRVRLDFID